MNPDLDWVWDHEHGCWCVYPADHKHHHDDNDFLAALQKTLGEK